MEEYSTWDKIRGKNIKGSPIRDFFSEEDTGNWEDPDSVSAPSYASKSSSGGEVEGSGMEGAEGAAGAAAASGGNPYALAASGGLKVLSMIEKRKAEERKARYQAQLDHKDNIRGALDKLIGISQGLRNL